MTIPYDQEVEGNKKATQYLQRKEREREEWVRSLKKLLVIFFVVVFLLGVSLTWK